MGISPLNALSARDSAVKDGNRNNDDGMVPDNELVDKSTALSIPQSHTPAVIVNDHLEHGQRRVCRTEQSAYTASQA